MIISKKQRVAVKRVLWVFIPAVLVLALGVIALDFYLIHRMTHPARTPLYGTPHDFQVIMQKPMWSDEKWKNSDSTQSVGWLMSHSRPAPAIILSHAYGSNRSELLTLGFELWKAGYQVLAYDMRGHGESPVAWSGLGTYEKDDIVSAIRFLKGFKTEGGQELLDGRVGLYGVELGGYVSLVASAQDPMVKAVCVDSAYPDVAHFINYRLKSAVGSGENLANSLVDWEYTAKLTELAMQVYLMRREDTAPAVESVSAAGSKKLFITAKGTGVLENLTRELSEKAREPKQIFEAEQTRLNRVYDKASSTYDQRVVAFFQDAIPTTPDKPEKTMQARASK